MQPVAPTPGTPGTPPTPGTQPGDEGSLGNTPAERLRRFEQIAPNEYVREYRLTVLHRLLMRGLALDQISQMMGLSVTTVGRLRLDLNNRMRQSARMADPALMRGQTLAFYEAMKEEALRPTLSNNVPVRVRLEAFRVAMQAEADKQRFLHMTGFFDAYRVKPNPDILDGEVDENGNPVASRDRNGGLTRYLDYIVMGKEDGVADVLNEGAVPDGSDDMDAGPDADIEGVAEEADFSEGS